MNISRSTLLAALSVLATTSMAAAQQRTATLAPIRDNTIYSASNSLSNGAGSRIFTGNNFGGTTRRALLMFDIAATIPPQSTINSVRLELTVAQTNAPDLPVDVHRVLADWGEGASVAGSGQGGGALATTGDATWAQSFFPGTNWTSPGGDFAAAASASTVCTAIGVCSWSSTQLTADVQAWLDSPTTAFGWLLRTTEIGSQTARAFHAREALVPTDAPRLVINYTPFPAATRSIGTGCTGGGSQPLQLTASGAPIVPNATFALSLTGGPTGAVQAIDFFSRPLPTPLPIGGGCNVYGDFAAFLLGVVVPGNLPLPIPNNPTLIGRSLTVQGLALDVQQSQLATSNGLVLEFGL